MTLAEERELEVIKGGLTYKKGDDHTPAPHWDAKYPWTVHPASLPNKQRCSPGLFLKDGKTTKQRARLESRICYPDP